MLTKTYTQKSNAVRAKKALMVEVEEYLAVCDVVGDKEQGFSLYIKLNHNVPSNVTAYLDKQKHAYVILAAPKAEPVTPKTEKPQARVKYANLAWPKAGGKCDAIWQIAQEYFDRTGDYPTPKAIRDTCEAQQIDTEKSTFTRQLYAWRKYTQASILALN